MPGYTSKELTLSAVQEQLKSIGDFIPFGIVFISAFYLLWPDKLTVENFNSEFPEGTAG